MKLRRYMDLARDISKNGTCPRARVGAVLLNDDRVIGLGWNGSPRGSAHCDDVGCKIVSIDGLPHCFRAVHSEENVIVNAAYGGAKTKGGIIFCTHSPCYRCARLIINAGIIQVFYGISYRDVEGIDLLSAAGVGVEKVPGYE